MQDLFTQALGINSPWFIKDVSFDTLTDKRYAPAYVCKT
jgi:hypothetical protein